MNKKRQGIYDKSGGKCWYCGIELKKGWHMDHLQGGAKSKLSKLVLLSTTTLRAAENVSRRGALIDHHFSRLQKLHLVLGLPP